MVEFTRRQPEPPELAAYRASHPRAIPSDFGSPAFHSVKQAVKRALSADQGGLCAYCESPLAASAGPIDHVKPKGGPNAHPHLAFSYDNFVHGCCHEPRHCGQKKADRLLHIEPGPLGCNDKFTLSTNGEIDACSSLSRQERHLVRTTRDQLGLNFAALRVEREKWIHSSLTLLQTSVSDFEVFISDKPFRFILLRLTN
jgi:uncharacterized protein (TIGR02646 family)